MCMFNLSYANAHDFFFISMIIKNVRTEIISCYFGGELKDKIQSVGSTVSWQSWTLTYSYHLIICICRNESVEKREKKKETPWRSVLLRVYRVHYWREEKETRKKRKKRRERRSKFDKSLVSHTLCSCDMLAEKKFVCHY
jgi:hypothetical protein